MTSEIGYGAAAIKAGEVKYQHAIADLVKEAGKKSDSQAAAKSAPPEHVGKKVDVSA